MGKDQRIPSYIFVPDVDVQDQESCCSLSLGSLSPLDEIAHAGHGNGIGRWKDAEQGGIATHRTAIDKPRTRSLPASFSTFKSSMELNSSSSRHRQRISKLSKSSSTSLQSMSEMAAAVVALRRQDSNDQPPKVPRRRGSIQASAASSCPPFVVPYPRAQGALAA